MIAISWARALSFFQQTKAAYCQIPDAVLADLAKFCRATEPCWHPDPRTHALLEGRREVWLRIQKHLNMPAEDLIPLVGRALPQNGDE